MSTFGRTRAWVRSLVLRARVEREMREEMDAHLAQAAERFRASGMTAIEAAYAARREFGVVGPIADTARDARGARLFHGVFDDVRYALRHFTRTPGRTALILVVLTLGIGVAASTISATQGLLARAAPGVDDDPSLVSIRTRVMRNGESWQRDVSYAELLDYARASDVFSQVAGWARSSVILDPGTLDIAPVTATAQFITPGYFQTLGVQFSAGHAVDPGRADGWEISATANLSAVLSDRLARQLFGAPARAVGRDLRINDRVVHIVGVTSPRFRGATDGPERMLWLPLSAWRVIEPVSAEMFTSPDSGRFQAIARLRDGVARSDADARVAAIVRQIAARRNVAALGIRHDYRRNDQWTARIDAVRTGIRLEEARGEDFAVMSAIGGAVTLILLICAMTVATLLIGSALQRHAEIGVRLALGASRRRIIRQLCTESMLLCTVAGTMGIVLYTILCRAVFERNTDLDIAPDWWTLLYTIIVAAITTAVCGLVPALNATRHSLATALKHAAPTATSRSRLQRSFVVAQIGLTQPLLIGLALVLAVLLRGLDATSSHADHVLLARFESTAPLRVLQQIDGRRIAQRLSALPGVVSAVATSLEGRMLVDAAVDALPLRGGVPSLRTPVRLAIYPVPPGYFGTLALPLVRGRDFTTADRGRAVQPVIITSAVATKLFGGSDPVGRLFHSTAEGGGGRGMYEIVGVVTPDPRNPEDDQRIRVYMLDTYNISSAFLLRTENVAEPLAATVRAILNAEAPGVPVQSIQTLAQIDREKRMNLLAGAGIAGGAGLVTLLLASVGLYAVVALAVGQRRREIGIRIALGATPSQIVVRFFRSGLVLSLIGLASGLPLSAIVLSFITPGTELPVLDVRLVAASIALVVVSVASLATWLSARRAAGVDPLMVLREI